MNQLYRITRLGLIVFVIALMVSSTDCFAQQPSLWQRRQPRMTSLITDFKAKRPGDLLFVTISERSDVDNTDQRIMQKQNSSSLSGDASYSITGGSAGGLGFTQESDGDRQFNGNTQFRSERGFTDRFTVTVVDSLPNGNLLISGSRDVALEGDSRRLILTGVVRSVDVTNLNTVSSAQVSDLTIRYESNGSPESEASFVNQSWFGKKVNRFWP